MPAVHTKHCKRLAVFAYYDKNGVVDDYAIFMLKAMREHCTDVCVVINGVVNTDGERRLKLHSTQIIFKDNIGYDFAAYKQAILDTKNITKYDEIVFFNQGLFGPISSLHTMFNKMFSKKKIDFWGVTNFKYIKENEQEVSSCIDNSFFVVKSSIIKSPEFLSFWQDYVEDTSSNYDAMAQCKNFTNYFTCKGFILDTYINTDKYDDYTLNASIDIPTQLLKEGNPFFKRKAFFNSDFEKRRFSNKNISKQLYNYIRLQTEYPISFINKNLFRTLTPQQLHKSLCFVENVDAVKGNYKRTAAVLWFAKEEMGELLCAGAAKMQKDTSLLCLFASEELRDSFQLKLPPKTQCIVIEEDGFSYLFGKLWKDVCVFENILYCHNNIVNTKDEFINACTIENAIESLKPAACGALLEQRDDLGAFIVAPILQNINCNGLENWPKIAEKLLNRLDTLGVNITLDSDQCPVSIKASMFFARTKAIELLSKMDFDQDMFDLTNNEYEYLLPIIVQNSEYHVAIACTQNQALSAVEDFTGALQEIVSDVSKIQNNKNSSNNNINVETILEALRHYNKYLSNSKKEPENKKKRLFGEKVSEYIEKIIKK